MLLNEVEKCILKEFNRQHLKADVIGIVMETLTSSEEQNMFLEYMVDNRSILLTEYDIFNKLNEILAK